MERAANAAGLSTCQRICAATTSHLEAIIRTEIPGRNGLMVLKVHETCE